MERLFTLLKKDFMELVRSRRLLVLVGFFLIMGISSPVLAKLTPEILKSVGTGQSGIVITIPDPSSKDAIDQYIKNLGGMGVLILIFLTAGVIADEKSRRTLEMILVKPIERSMVVVSKLTVLTSALLMSNMLSAALCIGYTRSLFTNLDVGRFILVAAALFLYLLTMVAISLSASTVSSSGLAASGISIGIYAALETVSVLIPRIAEYTPSFILSSYPELMASGWSTANTYSTVVSLLLIIILAIGSIQIFKRQEIER